MIAVRFVCSTAVLLASLGCYKYEPATLEAVPEGAHVRLLLSTEGQLGLMERARMEARELDGQLVQRGDAQWLFDVRSTDGAQTSRALYQRIDLAPRDVLRVDVRKSDPVRTAVLAGGIVGVAAIITAAAIGEQNPGNPPNGGPPPPESRARWLIRVPVLSW